MPGGIQQTTPRQESARQDGLYRCEALSSGGSSCVVAVPWLQSRHCTTDQVQPGNSNSQLAPGRELLPACCADLPRANRGLVPPTSSARQDLMAHLLPLPKCRQGCASQAHPLCTHAVCICCRKTSNLADTHAAGDRSGCRSADVQAWALCIRRHGHLLTG